MDKAVTQRKEVYFHSHSSVFQGLNKYKLAYVFYDCIESQMSTAVVVEVGV